jgi:molecular chaperone GrpE
VTGLGDTFEGAGGSARDGEHEPRVTDKRRIDPLTGAVREPAATGGAPGAARAPGADAAGSGSPADEALAAAEATAAERLDDLQRLQAEYANYRRRVDRDRLVARDQTVVAMVDALLGVLDDLDAARAHDDLTGPFAAVAEKLETSLAKFGWERYGAVGEGFDPTVHEALLHQHSTEVDAPTVAAVLQAGHRVGERIVRAARVAVADPEA